MSAASAVAARAVVVRGRDDVQAGQLGEQRLVLVDRLERALADLRLVRRVGGVELAARAGSRRRSPGCGGGRRRRPGSWPGRPGCAPPASPAAARATSSRLGARQVQAVARARRPGCRRRAPRPSRCRAPRASARGRPRCAGRRPSVSAAGLSRPRGQARYGVASSRPSALRRRSSRRSRIIQPSPYGSLLTSSGCVGEGLVDRAATSPATGRYRSLAVLTDSMTPKASPRSRARADRRQLHEDDVAQLVGGVGGDADHGLVALDAQPLVVVGVAQIRRAPPRSVSSCPARSRRACRTAAARPRRRPRRRGCRPRPWYRPPRASGGSVGHARSARRASATALPLVTTPAGCRRRPARSTG